MKPYFAKYLPVEGEIKKGDIVQWGPFRGPVYAAGGKDIKKLKLFLCSRNIQVGDKVEWIPFNTSSDVHSAIVDDGNLYHINKLNPFKILGEISPDATWVKEGDEFEEDEIEYWPLKGGTVPAYKIKGPCGHFH